MTGRGRGRGRGFGRGKSFSNSDQPNIVPVEKAPSAHVTATYPPLDQFPAPLITNSDYDELNNIQNSVLSYFQSSNYFLRQEDETARLFASQGESQIPKKVSLNFDWDCFPLELRPVGRRRLKDENDIIASWRKNQAGNMDLSWLDQLEEKEKTDVARMDVVKEEPEVKEVKKEVELPDDEEEAEEFDDEELDDGTDYNTNYFDNGEGYLDEDDDLDEPCY